ncbi:hypothetical protein JCM10908_006234 [Rhodotorula pacifica]|uniref:O-fucosyltransferase family protein n=1 Tax=Rhodotorula pacifica TaxID=1495444 RepID=UPI0031729679
MSHRTAYVQSPGEALLGRVFPHHPHHLAPPALYPPTPETETESDLDADENEIKQAEALLARSNGNGNARHSGTDPTSANKRGVVLASLQNWSRTLTQRSISRRLVVLAAAVAVGITTLYGAAAHESRSDSSSSSSYKALGQLSAAPGRLKDAVYDRWSSAVWSRYQTTMLEDEFEPLNVSHILNFDTPRPTLKEQLKPGVRYIVGNAYGGHANQFISIQKLLYFGKLTNRVGIIPTLIPVHLSGDPQNMSAFYDLDRFWQESGVAVIEFSRVTPPKALTSEPPTEYISCWSVYEACAGSANFETVSFGLHGIGLEHWPLPPIARALGNFDLSYDGLRVFDFDQNAKNEWIARVQRDHLPQRPTDGNFTGDPATNVKPGFGPPGRPVPEDQLMCFDMTMFLGPIMFPELPVSAQPLEPSVPGEGLSWMNVGQYLRFNPLVESRADELLVDLFGVSKISKVPPFITLHLRRGDFKDFTGLTDLDKYTAGLERAQQRLQARLDDPDGWTGPGKHAFRADRRRATDYPVVCTTDERGDSEFVQKVRSLGWKVVDHDVYGTVERYGGWWPTMLDGAILARGKSFVGTDRSTYSHLAGLRVKYWNGGVVEIAL